jgi:hypothetical protein
MVLTTLQGFALQSGLLRTGFMLAVAAGFLLVLGAGASLVYYALQGGFKEDGEIETDRGKQRDDGVTRGDDDDEWKYY